MLALTSLFCDVLPSEPSDPSYYARYVRQYALLTLPTVLTQAMLTAVRSEEEKILDDEVSHFVASFDENARAKRNAFDLYRDAAGMNSERIVQDEEGRSSISQFFVDQSEVMKISNRELVMSSLRASAFLNYYFLLEDTLKSLYYDTCTPDDSAKGKSGSVVISVFLKDILSSKRAVRFFDGELLKRSQFFTRFGLLTKMWSLMTIIRNVLVHDGGQCDDEEIARISLCVDELVSMLDKDQLVTSVLIGNVFASMLTETRKTGRLMFGDDLENCIRNLGLFVMESLILAERAAQRAQEPAARRIPR